jgi:hypothetical protein
MRFIDRGIKAAKASRSNRISDLKRLHRSNLQHNTEHRLAIAKAQGNPVLVALLERELAAGLA